MKVLYNVPLIEFQDVKINLALYENQTNSLFYEINESEINSRKVPRLFLLGF